MVELSDQQVSKIVRWVDTYGLTLGDLKNELIDHIACEVEYEMNTGSPFEVAFARVLRNIPEDQLVKIEEASLYMVNFKFRIMKQLTFFSGLLVLLAFLLGFSFRIFKPELTEEFLLAGMFILCLFFIPLFFLTNYHEQKKEKHKILHIMGFSGTFLISLSAILNYFAVDFSGVFIILGLLLLLFGFFPLFLISFSNSPYLRLVRGTLFLFVFIGILGIGFYNLAPSKDMIDYWVQQGEEIDASKTAIDKISERTIKNGNLDKTVHDNALTIHNKANSILLSWDQIRKDYIQSVDETYNENNRYFKGMDYSRTGMRIVNSQNARYGLKEISEYEEILRDMLSDLNEKQIQSIHQLLSWQNNEDISEDYFAETLNYLFCGYPVIVNSVIMQSIQLSVRLSELTTINYLILSSDEKAN
jgi:hypothetical protein